MASNQADERAIQAAEYAADQISQARNMPEEAAGDQKQGRADPGGGDLSSVLGAVAGKTAGLKDSAASAGRTAMEFLSEKKEEIKMKIPVAGDCPREVLVEMEEEGRKRMGDIMVEESAFGDNPEVEAAVREIAAKEAAAHRGVAAKSNIIGSMGSVKEAIRSKLTMPSQIVSETLAAQRHSGTGRATDAEQVDVSSGNTPVGVVDSIKLKASDVGKQAKEAATSNK
ncbi:hypothetical protein V2J09_010651 [Rumex salicifolius]